YGHSCGWDPDEDSLEYVEFRTTWARLVFRGRSESRKLLGFYLGDGVVHAVVGLNRGGDPDDPKVDGELKAAASLIRTRVAVDPARLMDEGVNLRALVK